MVFIMKSTLNENIKKLRIAKGLNQVEFARALSVTKQCVSNWENDNVLPSIEMLVKIAEFFNVSTDFLLGRTFDNIIVGDGLSPTQLAHIRLIIDDFKKANK